MSDLQCPATFWFVAARGADEADEADEAADAEAVNAGEAARLDRLRAALGATHVAAVHAAPGAGPLADAVVEAIDAPLQVTGDLEPRRRGEGGEDVARRWRTAVEEAADLYRGETVVVVGGAGSLGEVLRGLEGDLVRVEVDGDGWRVTGRA